LSAILNSISELEKELILVEGTLQNIIIWDLGANDLVINLRFAGSRDFDHTLIGGLTATINEFGGNVPERTIRSIKLEELKLIFTSLSGLLIVLAVEPEFQDDQFKSVMYNLCDTYQISFDTLSDDETLTNETAITTQLILSFMSEEVEVEMKLGPVVQIYPYKMREIAEARASDILGSPIIGEEEDSDTQSYQTDEYAPGAEPSESDDMEILSKNEALYHLLDKFVSTFSDAKEVTLIRFTPDGTIHKVTAGSLDKDIAEKVYSEIIGMLGNIVKLLSKSEEFRTMDLEDKWIYFQYVSSNAFIYITVESKDVLSLIRPLVERISLTISNLFPENQ